MTTRRSVLAMFVGTAIAAPILKYGFGETLWPGTAIIKPHVARTLTTMRALGADEFVRVQEIFASNDERGNIVRWIAPPGEEIIAKYGEIDARIATAIDLGHQNTIKHMIFEHPDGWHVGRALQQGSSSTWVEGRYETMIELDADGKRIVAPPIDYSKWPDDDDDDPTDYDDEGDV